MLLGTVPTLLAGDIPEHQIMRSVRLNYADTAYFSRTPTTPTSRRKFTVSVWVKRTALSTTVTSSFFGSGTTNVDDVGMFFSNNGPGRIDFYDRAASVIRGYVVTTSTFPDTSAWCHVVGVMDTESATPADRMQIYVNGIRQPVTINNQIPINTDTMIIGEHRIGRNPSGSAVSDLMVTEFYFIDGQALPPTTFAKFDAITGAWIPKVYTGTYGANGVYLKFADNSAATAAALGKDSSGMSNNIWYSDDFNNGTWWSKGNNAVLTAGQADPFGGTGAFKMVVGSSTARPYVAAAPPYNTGQTTTISVYAKAAEATIILVYNGSNHGGYCYFDLAAGTLWTSGLLGNGSNLVPTIQSVGGGWYKCAVTVTNGGPASPTPDGMLFVVENVSTTNGQGMYIYRGSWTEGAAVPKELQYTNGTPVANKNYTPNNISVTAGVGNDSLVDVPTNYGTDTGVGGEVRGNYATLDTLPMWGIAAKCTYTNGQLEVSNTGAYQMISTFGMSAGKWYCEMLVQTAVDSAYPMAGVWAGLTAPIAAYYPGYTAGSGVSYATSGNKYYEGTNAAYGAAFTTGDTIGIAVDADTGKVWFRKNGTWQASGDPVAGTNPALTLVGGLYFIGGAGYYGNPAFNFGQRPFTYAAPTGYKALCTQNLPIPAIKKPSDYFGVTVYDGNDATSRNITAGLGFQGDLWISKGRNLLQNNAVIDSARPDLWQATNVAGGDQGTGGAAKFISNGIQVGPINANAPYDMWNDTGNSYVGSVWKKGALPGVDIVTYTGSGVPASQLHSLGVIPKMQIVKARTQAYSWALWHTALAGTQYLTLNTTSGTQTDSTVWNSAGPFAHAFNIGTSTLTNQAGQTYLAYLFAEVPGFSRFGTYVGNGVVDGPFVWCGFSPRWILRKRIDTTGSWWMQEAARSPGNTNNIVNSLNTVDAELVTTYHADFLANGFKIRNTSNNQSGGTYLFAAFAISPFKTARIFAEPNHSGPPIVPPQNTTNFLVQAPTTVVTHQPFLFSVTARNAGGGTETGYNGTVHFTYTGQPLVLPADSTLTNGVGTFSATRNEGTGSIIVATDTVNGSITGQSGFIGYGGGG